MISVLDIYTMKSAFDIMLLKKISVKYVPLMMIKLTIGLKIRSSYLANMIPMIIRSLSDICLTPKHMCLRAAEKQ